jgi:hypothetical protein
VPGRGITRNFPRHQNRSPCQRNDLQSACPVPTLSGRSVSRVGGGYAYSSGSGFLGNGNNHSSAIPVILTLGKNSMFVRRTNSA